MAAERTGRIERRRASLGRRGKDRPQRVKAGLAFLFAASITGCAPAIYAHGRSAEDLPKRRDAIVLVGFVRGLGKPPSTPEPSEDEARQIEVARGEVPRLFKANDISLSDDPVTCPDCLRLKVFILYQPWNPLIGGHMIVSMEAEDTNGTELFSTIGVGTVTLSNVGLGYDFLTRRAIDQAAEKFITELRGTAIIPEEGKEATSAPASPMH